MVQLQVLIQHSGSLKGMVFCLFPLCSIGFPLGFPVSSHCPKMTLIRIKQLLNGNLFSYSNELFPNLKIF